MVKVTATIKIEFEVSENDSDLIKEKLVERLEDEIANEELMEITKLKVKEIEEEDDESFEDEDEE